MTKPIIGIVATFTTYKDIPIIRLDDNIRRAVIRAGGIPKLIFPVQDIDYENTRPRLVQKMTIEEQEELLETLQDVDGLIIPGGTKWYDFDMTICAHAIENDIPLLGICRGMQIIAATINKKFNNNNITLTKIEESNHHVAGSKEVHGVSINKSSRLYNIVKKENFMVNSCHSYKVTEIDTRYLDVSAYSTDGIIEGIEMPEKTFVVGVQWHPESITDKEENFKLFEELIQMGSLKKSLNNREQEPLIRKRYFM